jgi:glucose/arabinose dehydrogenase
MERSCVLRRFFAAIATLLLTMSAAVGHAQQAATRGDGPDTLPDGPQVLGTGAQRIRVVPIKGFFRPSALAFLPNGDILVAERSGSLRIVKNGALDPQPIANMPAVVRGSNKRFGLWDVAVHPRFAENRLIYFTYLKPDPTDTPVPQTGGGQDQVGTLVLARARFDGGHSLTDVKDIFVSNARSNGFAVARLLFAPDGKIFMSIGMPLRDKAHGGANRVGTAEDAQEPGSHAGKILRLNDDGTAPSDNPFVGKPGYRPEIYALGFRDPLGLIIHPQTGELWEVEHGPQGGDELNIVKAGANYGWPVVSYGRAYTGEATKGTGGTGPELAVPIKAGMEDPFLIWIPVIAPGGMILYTGDKFPLWKGNLLIGGMASTQLHMVVMNQRGLPVRREALMQELKQRIRDVKQGPDGLVYVTTDHEAGALLRIEPVADSSTK